jgi:hypothetical protein
MKHCRVSVLLFLNLFFLIGLALPSAAAEIRYDIEATFDAQTRTLRGVAEVTFEPHSERAFFLLLPNLAWERNPFISERALDRDYPHGYDPASIRVERVEQIQGDDKIALPFRFLSLPPAFQTYSLEETVLAVDLPQTADGPQVVRFQFTTQIPRTATGDEGIDDEILTWRIGWYPLLLSPEEAWCENEGRLTPCSDEAFPFSWPAAFYTARIWLPGGFELLCGADHVEPISGAPGEGISGDLCGYRVWNDTPARTLAIAAGSTYERFLLSTSLVPIEVFFRAGHEEEARLFATYAVEILDDYERRFGPYPRARLVVAENPNRRGLSMAADGIVWLSDLFFTHRDVTLPGILNRYCEFVLAHEIAHQWWGLSAGIDHNAEAWLSEGLAQYLAVSYYEHRHGAFGPNLFRPVEKGLLEDLVRSQFGFMNLREHQVEFPYLREVARGFDEALIVPWAEVQYDNASIPRLYNKGYLIARTLAAAVGEETFEDGLRTTAERFRYHTFGVEDLRAALEEKAGRSFADLFRVWLYEEGTVDYSVEILSRTKTETGHHTSVAVTRTGGTAQPVVIEVILSSGETIRREWDGKASYSVLNFESRARVVRATIDPDHLLPDRDRLNNHAPVQFVATTGKNAFPLDAYLVRPDPLTAGITISYLDRVQLRLGQQALGASVAWGRSHRFAFAAGVEQEDLSGTIQYDYTSFAQPETGASGIYWEPDARIRVAGHRVISNGDPLCYLHCEIVDLPSLRYSRTSAVSFDLTGPGAGRVAVSSFDEARLFPNVYLQGEVSLGLSFGELPSSLLFHLEELRSTQGLRGGRWVEISFSGRHKLYGSVALEFPVGSDAPYNLANLMMVDRSRARAFLACGSSWTSLDEFGKTTPYLEAGVEGLFDLSAIGGLLPIEAVVGYAVPLSEFGSGMIYLGLYL